MDVAVEEELVDAVAVVALEEHAVNDSAMTLASANDLTFLNINLFLLIGNVTANIPVA